MLCSGPMPTVRTLDDEIADLRADEERARLELEDLDRKAMRLSFREFVEGSFHVNLAVEFEPNWHVDALCANLQALYEEWKLYKGNAKKQKRIAMKYNKLIINIAPATLKSHIVMVAFIAWVWLDDPTFTFACFSINPTNVARDSENCRQLVTSRWYRETFRITWAIKEDIDSKGKFQNTAGGERIARGLLAKHTGIHVNAILVDDPDDAMDVHSEAERRKRAGKMESLMSRVADKRHCFFVVIQQRVHVDDCTGELLARGGWLHANYALQYSDVTRQDSPFFKDPRITAGDVLHPVRFTPEIIEALRIELGEFGFEAQCNGNPSPLSGGMFPIGKFKFCRIDGHIAGTTPRPMGADTGEVKLIYVKDNGMLDVDFGCISVDATFGSLETTASAVGIGVWAGKGVDRFKLDDRTKPRTYIETKDIIRELHAEWMSKLPALKIIIEKKANGDAVISELTQEFSGIVGIDVEGGKETRAYACTPDVDSGKVHYLDGAHWMPESLREVSVFPHGKRDDRVDEMSQMIAHYRQPTDAQKLLAKNAAFRQLANARMLSAFRS